ncbi:MAG: RidA family protein [Rickettsiales bacterium]|jgi:2-iminobutanoate/2-iminopropanoate deaminase|nr:RidA family protein [Rickettsiales bacterium]
MIENILPPDWNTRAPVTQVKKIDLGNCYIIFISGIQPTAGPNKVVLTNDIAEQTKSVFEEIKSSLTLAGASLDDVVKAVIYLTDINDFDIVSPIRADYFKNSKPVSTLIGTTGFSRQGAKIEVEVTAVLPK